MLRDRKRDPAEAEGIIAELERVVLFKAPQPADPRLRKLELPGEVGRAAHVLLTELRKLDRDARALLALMFGQQRAGVARCEAWVRDLGRLAVAPRVPRSGRPPRDQDRSEFEDAVVSVLKRAGLTWRDGEHAATVLGEVVGCWGKEARRALLRRAVARRKKRAAKIREVRALRKRRAGVS